MPLFIKYLIRLKFIVLLSLLASSHINAQISKAFYGALPKTYRPKDPAKLTLTEKALLLRAANIEFQLKRFDPELDKIAVALYAEVDQMPDKKNRVSTLGIISSYTRNKFNDPVRTLVYLDKLVKEINNDEAFSSELCQALILRGTLFIEKGEIESGVISLRGAEKIIKTKGHPKELQMLGYIYSTLSDVYIRLELFDQAITYTRLAAPYFKDVKPEQVKDLLITLAKLNSASAYIASYLLKNKVSCLDTATSIVRKVMQANNPVWAAACYGLLGEISYLKKDYRRSVLYLDSADLPEYAKLDNTSLLPERIFFRGLNLVQRGKTKEGDVLVKKAMGINNETYSPLSYWYQLLYGAYKQNGDFKTAALYLEQYTRTKDSINVIGKNIAFADISEKYKSAQKEARIQQLNNHQLVQQKQQRLTVLLAVIAVLVLLLLMVLIYLFSKRKVDKQARKQQELEKENLRISQSLMDQETKMLEERYESLRLLREKISNDMHNELGSALVSLNFYINDIQNNFREKDQEMAAALNNIKEEASSIYIQTRDYIHDLQENAGDVKFDLVNFLLYLPLHFEQSTTLKIRTDIAADPLESRLTVVQNNEFYLFVKEALANILKHSGATFFTIKISFAAQNCEFLISDNGKGFNLDSDSAGMGVKNMKERIINLNGTLSIKSNKKGTALSGTFPVNGS